MCQRTGTLVGTYGALLVRLHPCAGSAANMWVVGCNVSAFNEWAARVLSLGYTVAR